MQGVKGKNFENRSQKVFSWTLAASYFVQDIRATLSATCPWRAGEADENLPKWSWSPLSRSSSWSWSRSSVSCDVGVHQPNWRGPCRTFDNNSKRREFWVKICCCWMRSCPAAAPVPANARASRFPKWEYGTQFEKGKKETDPPVKFLILWKGKPF